MRPLLALGYMLLRWHCRRCGGLLWPWQVRCNIDHRTCAHAEILRLWAQNQAMTPTVPLAVWPCRWCGTVPS